MCFNPADRHRHHHHRRRRRHRQRQRQRVSVHERSTPPADDGFSEFCCKAET